MKKALVVDDTKNIRILLTTCLEINGYDVITADNGKQALELIETSELNLIFLDVKMPEISGTEVLRRIRAMGKELAVVIMTAYPTVKNAVDCTKLGAAFYLQKPFTSDKVKNILNEIEMLHESGEEDIPEEIMAIKKLINEDRTDEALLGLKKALAKDITNGKIYDLIGEVYEKQGDIGSAKKFYNMAKQF